MEIKSWRKSLGIERTARIKLEKKLKTTEIFVNILKLKAAAQAAPYSQKSTPRPQSSPTWPASTPTSR